MSDDQVQVVLEYFDNKFDALVEVIQIMNPTMSRIATHEDMEEVKLDIKIIKKVLTGTNQDLRKLEKRVTKLEAAA